MLMQVLLEAIIVIALFSVLWLVVVWPILKLFGNQNVDQPSETDPECGTKIRKKIDELKSKQKELEELSRERNVTEDLARVDAEILRLRAELAEIENSRPSEKTS